MSIETAGLQALHTQSVYGLTKAVAAATGLPSIFDAALDCLGASLGTARSAILLFDHDNRMRFRAWRNLSEQYRDAVDGHSPWTRDTVDPLPVLVPDVRLDESLAELRATIEGEGIRALAFIPLLAGPKLIGKFMVYFDRPHEFEELELMMAQTVAAQVAFAVEHQMNKEANTRLEAVNRAVIDSFGVAVYATDAAGRITRYNRAAADLWGRKPIVGEDLWCGSWKLYWPDGKTMAHEACPMAIALQEDRSVRGVEILVENPDGSRHTVLPYPTPIHDSEGDLVGAVNVLVDITAQTEMRSALSDALRAKDDFLGQMSHELRTPLTVITGNADYLVRGWDDVTSELKFESLTEILQQSQRMQRLVNNMLILSRLERGIMPELEPQLLQRLMNQTLAEFKRRYPLTVVEVDCPEELPAVETNGSTVDQILWNLLTNAQKYGPEAGPIQVSLRSADGGVEVRVCDVGPGIPDGEFGQLFETYFRSTQTSEHAAGLGLGLSVCKRLIDAQGGRIWALRRTPAGMEFGFALPCHHD